MQGKKFAGGVALLLIVVLAGCVAPPTGQVVTENVSQDIICIPKSNLTQPAEQPTQPVVQPDEFPGVPRKTFIEGDLVSLTVKATDADNDKIMIKYSKPLDNDGQWQTKVGDAGKYLITISATDGKAETSKQVLIILDPQNHPPVMKKIVDMTVSEGETVSFLPEVTDQDRDPITITYSGWMSTPSYQVKFGDSGKQKVTITASDGKAQVSQTVEITVRKGNRAPVLKDIAPITVTEGEDITVKAEATDPDGDTIAYSYSAPLDRRGRWETEAGDAGTYTASISASDGKSNSTKSVSIVVLSQNHAPEIKQEDVTVNVGETIRLNPDVSDKDGDEIKVSYSGWMDGPAKSTVADDVGTHIVTITATDGEATTNFNVKVTVNSPPQFTFE